MACHCLVYVVDDDDSMRRALDRLLRSAGLKTELFASAQEFLDQSRPGGACIVLDVKMPGMTGLALQQRLATTQPGLPVVLITAYASDALRRQALAAGASAFLRKPFEDCDLLEAVTRAIGGSQPAGP